MFELGSFINIDKSGVGRNICCCARFPLMLWPFFLTRLLKNDNRPQIGKNQTFLHISILGKSLNLNFDFFNSFVLNRDFPQCAVVVSGQSRVRPRWPSPSHQRVTSPTPRRTNAEVILKGDFGASITVPAPKRICHTSPPFIGSSFLPFGKLH